MQLVGFSESQPSSKSNVALDKNCMSCLGGQANQMEKHRVIQAFKLACLNYNPSKITKDGEEIERAEGIARALEGLVESSRIQGLILSIKEKYAEDVKPEFKKLIIGKDQNNESEGSRPQESMDHVGHKTSMILELSKLDKDAKPEKSPTSPSFHPTPRLTL